MNENDQNIETHGNFSPGVVHGNFEITQTIVNQFENSKRRRWRELGEIFRPLEDNETSQNNFIAHLIVHLHRVFKNSGYIRFICLFCSATSTYKGKSWPGYLLISHQIPFIGALRKSWRYLWNSDLDLDARKKYQDLLNEDIQDLMQNWSLKHNIDFTEDISALEFIYNPDEHKITILKPEIVSDDPVDYVEKVRTTSEFLIFLSVMVNQSGKCCFWQDFECISSHYPLYKFCINILDNGTVNLHNVRINVENFEEYDYINNEFDLEVQSYKRDN